MGFGHARGVLCILGTKSWRCQETDLIKPTFSTRISVPLLHPHPHPHPSLTPPAATDYLLPSFFFSFTCLHCLHPTFFISLPYSTPLLALPLSSLLLSLFLFQPFSFPFPFRFLVLLLYLYCLYLSYLFRSLVFFPSFTFTAFALSLSSTLVAFALSFSFTLTGFALSFSSPFVGLAYSPPFLPLHCLCCASDARLS